MDSLKGVFNVFRRKPWLGAPEALPTYVYCLCTLFIVVSSYIFFTGMKYSDQVSFAVLLFLITMYRSFSVLWALKISRFTFSFALAFLVLYIFLCLAHVFTIFVHTFHLCPLSFFPLGLRCFARLFLHISWLFTG